MNNPECAREAVRQISYSVTNVSISVIVGISQVIVLGFNKSITAQIIPDNTLGAESSVVTPDNINNLESDRISGGAVRGSNLFHSFREFNINEGKGAYFDNPAAIQNIFSRVTGNNPSNIMGTLGVLGNANLFFMNPNGIIFGNNARLDIRGSFLATTADSILFPDGNKFSALNPEAPPLLTVNVQQPIGLELEGREGLITNQGILAVDEGKNLALVGGDLTIDGGGLITSGGRVDLGGLSEAGTIGFSSDGSLSFPDGVTRGDVSLTNSAFVDVRAGGGGSIGINARNLELREESQLLAGIEAGMGNPEALGGDIVIDAQNTIAISQGSDIFNQVASTGVGDAGRIEITTTDLSIAQGGKVDATTFGVGDAGKIEITTTDLLLTGGGRVDANTLGKGNAGQITIAASGTVSAEGESPSRLTSGISSQVRETGVGNSGGINITTTDLLLTGGGRVSATTLGKGNAGQITIAASGTISAERKGSNGIPSGIYSRRRGRGEGNAGMIEITTTDLLLAQGSTLDATTSGVGNAGNLTINTQTLIIRDGAQVSSGTLRNSTGNGGNLTVNASDLVEVIGEAKDVKEYSRLTTRTQGSGNAGNLTINTKNFLIQDGAQVSTKTFGEDSTGDAGDLTVNASDSVKVIGEAKKEYSRLTTRTEGSGNAGTLTINTQNFIIRDGAQVSSGTLSTSTGNGGNLTINASDAVEVLGESSNGNVQSRLTTRTGGKTKESGNAGSLTINTKNFLIQDGAQVSTKTFGEDSTGDAGDLTVNASDSVKVIGESKDKDIQEYSRLTTRTEGSGNAGNLTINTQNFIIRDGAQVSSGTFRKSTGDAGDLTVNASDAVEVLGESSKNQNVQSRLTTRTEGGGNAGNLNINAKNFIIRDGAQVSSGTLREESKGDGGNLTVTVSNLLEVSGESKNGREVNSRLTNRTEGEGDAKDLNINTQKLIIKDGGQISADTFFGSTGLAGNLTVNASEFIKVIGTAKDNFPSSLSSKTISDRAAGDIRINTPQLIIDRGASISATTTANGDSGTITVNAPQAVILRDGGSLTVETSAAGKPGDIFITTPHLTIGKDAEISATATETSTNTEGGGSITLNTSNLDLTGKLGIFAETQGEAPAGTLNIQPYTEQTQLDIQFTDTAILSTLTTASGAGGDINLTAPETININGQGQITAETNGSGNAGNINIETKDLNISDQTEISALTSGTGSAGKISVLGTDSIALDNISITTTIDSDAIVNSDAESSQIEIKTARLSLKDTQVSASTSGTGDAGNIDLEATENLSLNNSNISSAVTTDAVGNAGNVQVIAPSITITDNSELSTATDGEGNAGRVTVKADEIVSLSNSRASSAIQSQGNGTAGVVEINAPQISVTGSQISSSTAGEGEAGEVNLIATENLELNNTNISSAVATGGVGDGKNVTLTAPSISITNNSELSTATDGEGNAGRVTVRADEIVSLSNSSASSAIQSNGQGTAGVVEINAPQISLTNSQISSSTAGKGEAGTVAVKATNLKATNGSQLRTSTATSFEAGSIILEVEENINLSGENSGIFASTTSDSEGIGGSIRTQNFTPNRIIVEQGAAIAVNSEGRGEAGSINLQTEELTLDNGAINLSTDVAGDAGDLIITTPNLTLRNGGNITAQTSGEGKAGDIFLEVRENMSLTGNNSGIFANTADNSTGEGGSILTQNATPNRILVEQGAAIAVNSQGEGEGGDIKLEAGLLTLDRGSIDATTASNQGGNITLTATDRLRLRNQSKITATAGINEGRGDGGNITIDAPFIIAVPQEDSDITANAFEGNGGNINITTQGIFGIEFRNQETVLSDITASSEFGQQGEVNIDTEAVDPTRGLNNLPQQATETEVAQSCQANNSQTTLEFFDIGRGGLPPTPEDLLNSEVIIAEWMPLNLETTMELPIKSVPEAINKVTLFRGCLRSLIYYTNAP